MKLDKIQYILVSVWAALLLLLGVWWLYLLNKFSKSFTAIHEKYQNIEEVSNLPNISSIIIWEGSFFFFLILILSASFIMLMLRDKKKNQAISAFFASLTHELKTPLASIKLQSEVINNHVQNYTSHDESQKHNLVKLSDRLNEDTENLEIQMDKILQLSRVENGGRLSLTKINLSSILTKHFNHQKIKVNIKTHLSKDEKESIYLNIDEFAMDMICKNLFENTLNHAHTSDVLIETKMKNEKLIITYTDQGEFNGDINKLGRLFYKYDSSKGSGIGLYLIKKLMQLMNGELKIQKTNNHLKFCLEFLVL